MARRKKKCKERKRVHKQFYPHHNAMQSGRGRETDGEAEKEGQREEGMAQGRREKQTFRDTECERWRLDQPSSSVGVLISNHKVALT